MDPHGFQMVRSRLEEIFPRLSDVATSSVGASVGGYLADFDMSPAQITKAYLASHGMDPDGLGARVVQSKFTGRFRPACKELWNMFDDRTKAATGTASRAYASNPHFSDAAYESTFDRNLLLYAMLEIKLSLDKDSLSAVEYSTLTLFDTICGSGVGGHRVPVTNVPVGTTHDFNAGYEIDTFAPVVNYGSLATLQSAYMSTLADCRSGFAAEDMALNAYCNMADSLGAQRSYLRLEAAQRAVFSPFLMHRDRYCSASEEISIEDALARPPQHLSNLFDTPSRSKFMINYWIVPAWARGEEQIDARTLLFSMRSFVYVTSSHDPSVRPGMHRLIDLPVFGDVTCNALPGANCGPSGVYLPINTEPLAMANFETQQRTTGRNLMRRVRASQLIEAFTGQTPDRAPYAVSGTGCFAGDLVLVSRPVLYSSRQWLSSLVTPPPSPPPLSPSPPPPNPFPPNPSPPPIPPYMQPQSKLMTYIRDALRAAGRGARGQRAVRAAGPALAAASAASGDFAAAAFVSAVAEHARGHHRDAGRAGAPEHHEGAHAGGAAAAEPVRRRLLRDVRGAERDDVRAGDRQPGAVCALHAVAGGRGASLCVGRIRGQLCLGTAPLRHRRGELTGPAPGAVVLERTQNRPETSVGCRN